MSWYEALARPLLFHLPAETAHELGVWCLSLADLTASCAEGLRRRAGADRPSLAVRVAGLSFPNPLGLAAGLDKNAEAMVGLFGLGFGFLEVGTVTPRPQPGNARPRLFRLPECDALINRMGFNNQGVAAITGRLRELEWRPGPVGVNIGKNRDTPLAEAPSDYLACAGALDSCADYLTVNLSSPNTPGLRSLQEPQALESLLRSIRPHTKRPLFLKIAPDLSDEALDALVDVASGCSVDALVCTNTTISRPVTHRLCAQEGGLSGRPLLERSTEILRRVFRRTQGKLPLVGAGGIFSGEDAWAHICAGASLVQIYTGLIYKGPSLPRHVLGALEQKVEQTGLASISQAVGRNA